MMVLSCEQQKLEEKNFQYAILIAEAVYVAGDILLLLRHLERPIENDRTRRYSKKTTPQ